MNKIIVKDLLKLIDSDVFVGLVDQDGLEIENKPEIMDNVALGMFIPPETVSEIYIRVQIDKGEKNE